MGLVQYLQLIFRAITVQHAARCHGALPHGKCGNAAAGVDSSCTAPASGHSSFADDPWFGDKGCSRSQGVFAVW